MSTHSKAWNFLLKLALTFLAFWLVLYPIDFQELGVLLARQEPWALGLAAAGIGMQVLFGAWRWEHLLSALSLPMPRKEVVRLYYIGAFFSNCLPGAVGGDVVRVWIMKRRHFPLTPSIYSVLMDRLSALFALSLLIVATLPVLAKIVGFTAWPWMLAALFVIFSGGWSALRLDRLLMRFNSITAVQWLRHITGCLRMMAGAPRTSFNALICAALAHVSFCISAYVLVNNLGAPISWAYCLALIPWVQLAATLPVSIGGWGVREAGMVGLLALAGVPKEIALTASLELGFLGVLVCLPAGALWLMMRQPKEREAMRGQGKSAEK